MVGVIRVNFRIHRLTSNFMFDQTAGSRSLAAVGQRGR
jgi:hypothetical protein